MARLAFALIVAGLLLPGPAVAQEAPVAPAMEESAPESTMTAPPVTGGERVEIRVRTGISLSGVVKSRQFEVLVGSTYYPAEDVEQPGTGLRVYYAMGLNGFIFIRQDAVEEIKFLGKLSDAEIRAIVFDLEEAEKRAERDRARIAAAAAARKAAARGEESPDGTEEPGAAEETEKSSARELFADTPRTAKIRELLARFPPADWTPDRLDEIKKRVIVLDIFPNEEERAFIDHYDLWLEGYRLWQDAQKEAVDGAKTEAAEPEK